MIHPDTSIQTISEIIGVGVIAKTFIPKGTIIVARDSFDLCLTQEAFDKLPLPLRDKMETYMYYDKFGNLILGWDHSRYMNHHCQSNTLMTDYDFEIVIRDINAGEEITTDYGLLNVQEPYQLHCGCQNCRGILRLDDIDRFADQWDKSIRENLLRIKQVHQPLEHLLSEETRNRLDEFLDRPERYRSVRNLKWLKEP